MAETNGGAFITKLLSRKSGSVDTYGNRHTNPGIFLFNLTPTSAFSTDWVDTYDQTFLGFQLHVTSSDSNPAHGTASFQYTNVTGSRYRGQSDEFVNESYYFTEMLTSSAGLLPGIPITAKEEKAFIKVPSFSARYGRITYTPSGAGSGSMVVIVKGK